MIYVLGKRCHRFDRCFENMIFMFNYTSNVSQFIMDLSQVPTCSQTKQTFEDHSSCIEKSTFRTMDRWTDVRWKKRSNDRHFFHHNLVIFMYSMKKRLNNNRILITK